MKITGNKGDWSELYTMLKLLGDGVLYSADGNMNRLEGYFYPILNIIRKEEGLNFERKPSTRQIVIFENENKILEVPISEFVSMYKLLFEKIVIAKQSAFSISEASVFMDKIRVKRLKSVSKDKKDIVIKIHDFRTGMQPTLGFSIKSMLGKDSTLFNYSEGTNITYKITGDMTTDKMAEINQISDQLERMDRIYDLGLDLEFSYYNKENFYCNLQLVDTLFPEIMAELVRLYFYRESDTTSVKSLLNLLQERNTFGISNAETFYPHKMKQLLVYVALGMTATDPWSGRYDANGGYIVVKKDGDVVCYHFYDRNDIEDYLFNNTRFDNPSRDRCGGWGFVFKGDDNNFYITLNFQIKSLNNKQRITKRIRAARN